VILLLRDLFLTYIHNENLALGISIAIVTSTVLLLGYGASYVAKHFLPRLLHFALARMSFKWSTALIKYGFITRLSYLVPTILIYLAAGLFYISDIPATELIVAAIRRLSIVIMLFIGVLIIDSCLNATDKVYLSYNISRKMPIKIYLQVVKILLYFIAVVVLIAVLLNKSPVVFFTGLGAMMAVILVVFKDSILGFVTSVQLAAYDVVRVGDWIEMSNFGVDGDVIDISLNTVKIRNFDKAIITIPTHALISSGVKNWRGMRESGGRRIKRSINLDLKTVKFCDAGLLERLSKVVLISEYIENKRQELQRHNDNIVADKDILINTRNLTNLGCFRAYVNAYLRNNNNLHQTQEFMLMVRYLQPEEHGLPMEIYVFSKNTDSVIQEEIQADIFDHIIAAAQTFELSFYQK
jgi:miniconductance mechanosensitive channel